MVVTLRARDGQAENRLARHIDLVVDDFPAELGTARVVPFGPDGQEPGRHGQCVVVRLIVLWQQVAGELLEQKPVKRFVRD